MKPVRFKYLDPASLDEAVEFLGEHGDDSKLLAGGQSLMPMVNLRLARPDFVVDLSRVSGLDYTRAEDHALRIGALASQEAALESSEVRTRCSLLVEALRHVGHAPIRCRGTIGGSIAHADPAAELPALAVALDAELTLQGAEGKRTVSARDFFVTFFTTTLRPDEVLTEIRVPTPADGARGAVLELARRHGDFALVGVLGVVTVDDGRIGSARLAAFGVDEVPRRLTEVEEVLTGAFTGSEVYDEAAALASRSVEPRGDIHATADYRRQMVGLLTRRLLRQTVDGAADAEG